MDEDSDPLVYPRIRSIRLTCWERPLRAVIVTRFGIVRVRWQQTDSERRWTAIGRQQAVDAALPAIEHVEMMCESMH